MNYPTIAQYTETIKLAANAPEDYFDKLRNLCPVLDKSGEPIMSSGNYAVVFKMYNSTKNKYYALKCFHREQKGRENNYKKIAEELNREISNYSYGTYNVSSSYLIRVQYYEEELFVDIGISTSAYPVLLMEWVDGITLDKYILENLSNTKLLHELAYNFSRMAKWLLSQRFAHGDLKPDNILITNDFRIILVDYDGMYVPSMKDQKSNELGNPNFRHPNRTIDDFDEHIDDFPIVIMLLSLKAVSLQPYLFAPFITGDKMLFDEHDYLSLENNRILPLLKQVLYDKDIVLLLGVFFVLLQSHDFPQNISSIIDIRESIEKEKITYSEKQAKCEIERLLKCIDLYPPRIVRLLSDLFSIDEYRTLWLPKPWYKYSVRSVLWDQSICGSVYRQAVEDDSIFYSVLGEFSKKSRPDILKMNDIIYRKKWDYLVEYTYKILFEMGVSNSFVENVDKLISIVKKNKERYDIHNIDYPF